MNKNFSNLDTEKVETERENESIQPFLDNDVIVLFGIIGSDDKNGIDVGKDDGNQENIAQSVEGDSSCFAFLLPLGLFKR